MPSTRMFRPSALEEAYLHTPNDIATARVVIIGSGLGLDIAAQIVDRLEEPGASLSPADLVVLEAGSLDLLTHMANVGLPRINLMRLGHGRVGGKTPLWGCATPRPPADALDQWPYPQTFLDSRFRAFEAEMGVDDPIPLSGRLLDRQTSQRLADVDAERQVVAVRTAPVAINAAGHRWSALDRLADLLDRGVRVVPHARCTRLVAGRGKIQAIEGVYRGQQPFQIAPEAVVVAVGVEHAVPLLAPLIPRGVVFQPADHIRIDLNGVAPATEAPRDPHECGIAVHLVDARSCQSGIPYHLEVKVGPKCLWSRYMPSGDNLRSREADILVQVQAIAAMHGRLTMASVVRDPRPIQAQVSFPDSQFPSEISALMHRIGSALGVQHASFGMRPLLENHHLTACSGSAGG